MDTSKKSGETTERALAQGAVDYDRWGLAAEAEEMRRQYRHEVVRRMKEAAGVPVARRDRHTA